MQHPDADHFIKLNLQGVTCKEIAALASTSSRAVVAAMVAAGHSPLTNWDLAWARAELVCPGARSRLVADYEAGEPILSISERLGVSRGSVKKELQSRGAAIRTASDQERIKWQAIKSEPGATERQCSAAWAASRGSIRTDLHKRRVAIGQQRARSRVGRYEAEIAAALAALGLNTMPQLAVGVYNIDVAIHADRIAVEVLGAKYGRCVAERHGKKSKHLHDCGWTVVWVVMHANRDIAANAEKVAALAHRIRRGEASRGHDWVVRCDGDLSTPACLQYNEVPVVLSPDCY